MDTCYLQQLLIQMQMTTPTLQNVHVTNYYLSKQQILKRMVITDKSNQLNTMFF